ILRNAVALIAVLLVLLLGVRPLIKALKREPAPAEAKSAKKRKKGEAAEDDDEDEQSQDNIETVTAEEVAKAIQPAQNPETGVVDAEALARQVSLAQRLVVEKPDSALVALKQMLKTPEEEGAPA
ncbi:MAG: flagellar M-ring protein FliF, partial [Novosphingobium sp.]